MTTMTTPAEDPARAYVTQLRGFYIHLAIYAAVSGMLFLFDWLTPGGPWFYWPVLGWGVAVGINAVAVFISGHFFGASWENHKLEEYRRRARSAGVGPSA